jgi:hypothetical protein
MLDYAANGVVYWPLEQLRELFVRQCERDCRDLDSVISELVGEETDVEEFWAGAGNLRAGKVRMVVVRMLVVGLNECYRLPRLGSPGSRTSPRHERGFPADTVDVVCGLGRLRVGRR